MKKGFLILALLFVSFSAFAQNELPKTEIKTLKGETVLLSSLHKKDNFLIISFWATWCIPCRKETEKINSLLPEWKKTIPVDMIAISTDDARTLAKVKTFVQTQKWNFDVYTDVNSDTKRSLNYQTVPFLILVDKEGKIIYRHNGYKLGDEEELLKVLNEHNK